MLARFHAWWEGEAKADRADGASEAPTRAPLSAEAASLRKQLSTGDPNVLAREVLWGDGRVGPGENDDDIRQTAALALDANSSVCWLGVGLATPAATLAAASGAYITGLEWRESWLERAQKVVAAASLGRRLTCEPMGFDPLELPDRKFDAFCAIERLSEAPDLPLLLQSVRNGLKDDGLLLCIETVSEEVGEEETQEGPPTAAAWREMLTEAGLDVRVAEEVTGAAIAREQAAWRSFLERLNVLAEAAVGEPKVRGVLARVVHLLVASQNRLKALENGDLAVYRFLAAKTRRGG